MKLEYKVYDNTCQTVSRFDSHKLPDGILFIRVSGKIGKKSFFIKYNSDGDLRYSRTLNEWGWWPLKIVRGNE